MIASRGGQLALVLAALTAAPLFVALGTGETAIAARYAIVAGVLAIGGQWLAKRPAPVSMQVNEALVVTALAFTLTPLLMAWPLMVHGVGFGDALFECISGITTTGLSTLASVEGKPTSFMFMRAWLQWIGGLGIVVLSVALLFGDDTATRRLVGSPISPDTLDTSTRLHARRSFVIYALLTLAAIAALWVAGWRFFDAVVLALSAVSTGGFAPHDAGLAVMPHWPARFAVVVVATLGAVSLPLYHAAWRGRWRSLAEDTELRMLLLVSLIVWLLLAVLATHARGAWSLDAVEHAALLALSAQSTSGFADTPPAALDSASQLVLIASMAIGGSVGSTAGGIKLLRLALLLRVAQAILRRTAMPSRAVTVLRVHQRPVSAEDMGAALFLVLLFVATVLLSWLPFLYFGHAPLPALFEVVSAVATAGLSAGVCGPGLQPVLKGVLAADMLLGRVEFVALLVAFYPPTWIGRRRTS